MFVTGEWASHPENAKMLLTHMPFHSQGVQQAREQLRKSFKGSALAAVNAARGAAIFLSKRYKK